MLLSLPMKSPLFVLASLLSGSLLAAAELTSLGPGLTPVGAEQQGNAAGTIPAWEGGLAKAPPGFTPGAHHPDPFPEDPILFTVTAKNLDTHRAQLGPGLLAMFGKYPGLLMHVYPTRRSAAFPQRIYQMTLRNAQHGQMLGDGEGVAHVSEGFPFPLPKTGAEVIWNHRLKYKGSTVRRWENLVTPSAAGAFTPVRIRESMLGLYFQKDVSQATLAQVSGYFLQEVMSPPRLAGNVLLGHGSLNPDQPRQAWIYNQGQRRVRKAPQVGYDNPSAGSDGLRSNDMSDMFNGSLDRYNFKLLGKREMLVNYNSYKAHAVGVKYQDFVRPGFLNPELMHYELHRVWVVDATLKPGKSHQMARRTFYLDEDSWQIMMLEHYDSAGQLWRYSEAAGINYYDQPLFWTTVEAHYDLKSGRYLASGLDNLEDCYDFQAPLRPEDFSPQSLRNMGTR